MTHERDRLDPRLQYRLQEIENYLASQANAVREKLRNIFAQCHAATLPRLLENKDQVYRLEYFRGYGHFSLSLELIRKGAEGYNETDQAFGQVFTDWEESWYNSPTWEKDHEDRIRRVALVPVPLEDFSPLYQRSRDDLFGWIKENTFHSWFAHLWQECGGRSVGVPSEIAISDSSYHFDLFQCLWFEYIIGQRPSAIYPLPRPLSRQEIYFRCTLDWPSAPFKTYWRYFEKGGVFREIGLYRHFTAQRSGNTVEVRTCPVENLTEWPPKEEQAKFWKQQKPIQHLLRFCNQALIDGYTEKPRPDGLPRSILKHAPEFDGPVLKPVFSGLSNEAMREFKSTYQLELPEAYEGFLKTFNGCTIIMYAADFPVTRTAWKRLNRFLGIGPDQVFGLGQQREQYETIIPREFLVIGITEAEEPVCLKIKGDSFGAVFLLDPKTKKESWLAGSFDDFLYGLTDGTHADHEVIYYARNNHVAFFKDLLKTPWEVNTNYRYDTATQVAADSNSHEVLELLLQNGGKAWPDPDHNHWEYDERTRVLLEKYR